MNKIEANNIPDQTLYTTMTNNLLKDELSDWFKSLHKDHYHYYVTFRSRPVVNRKHLEGMIKEWSKRLNKLFIGRNWSKESNSHLRMDGIVFFEKSPDLHAHAIIKPPISNNHPVTEYELIWQLQDQWNVKPRFGKYGFKKPTAWETALDKRFYKNQINRNGDCLVQRLNTSEDIGRVSHYSLKQSRLNLMAEYDDFKFLNDLESYQSNHLVKRHFPLNFPVKKEVIFNEKVSSESVVKNICRRSPK